MRGKKSHAGTHIGRWWIADLNLIMYFRMMYGTVGNCLWQMCPGRGIISNNEKCSYYVILKRIRTSIIGKMIIPVSLINSSTQVCVKDVDVVLRRWWMTTSVEVRSDLREVAWCLICATHWGLFQPLLHKVLQDLFCNSNVFGEVKPMIK
jgi:hypothetical protein